MKLFLKFFHLLLALGLVFFSTPSLGQFHLNGAAVKSSDSCWTLTPDVLNVAGSIWSSQKINLNNSFQVIMELNFGCRDADGADGILFGFQPLSTSIGSTGEGIGFQGVRPSLGIEFDTWQNTNLSDPAYDHIAIIKNGNLNHSSTNNLSGPVQANATKSNIEDCQNHPMRVTWDAKTRRLEVWFDCTLRLSYTGDIVNEIFGGDPWVFWGFTSSTGGARNQHRVCFSYTTFLDGFKDVVICPGGQYQLKVGGGMNYKWSPPTGLNNPNIPNPIAAPKETTTYFVEVTDACNIPFYDSLTVFIDGDTVFFDLGADTVICAGQPLILDATSFGIDTVTYLWSNGATTPQITKPESSQWSVTVTVDKYCVADDRVHVSIKPLPSVQLRADTSLCFDQVLQLDVSKSIEQAYRWNDGTKGPLYSVYSPGRYEVTAFNNCGTDRASFEVSYRDCKLVYYPNAFSPNGDGTNDTFFPFAGGNVVKVIQFRVFDRWGSEVFRVENLIPDEVYASWDGSSNSKSVPAGTYAWFAEVVFQDGSVEMLKGDVLLLR